MKKLVMAVCLLLPAAAYAQTEVTSGVTRGKDYGIVYTLPKTEIEIEVKAVKTSYTPGQFSRYAERYLRLTDVSADAEEYWTLKSVKASALGVPDSESTYFVKLKDKTVAPLMELTEDGIVKSINMPFDSRQPEAKREEAKPVRKKIDPRDFLTEEILMASSSAKMAELISKEIYSIRESRNALLRGQADNMPKDGEQLKLMLDNLEAQERAMVEMFSGVKEEEEKIYTIRIVPDKEYKDEVAFRFSKKLGVLGKDDLAGEPVYFTITDLKAITLPEAVEDKKKITEGVAYNVPGRIRLTITNGKERLSEEEFPATQFGIVEYLAPVLFNKKSTIKVIFNPVTGGLVKVDRDE